MARSSTLRLSLLSLLAAPVLLVPSTADANGQSTHLWITDDALTHIPEGPLKEFLNRPELRQMLENGTMFPDGGYPIGDAYGELAHWEPFQALYFDWITANYPYPIQGSEEGSQHLAFLMGLGSHGLADQIFDSLYGERVKIYDGAIGEFDTSSDIIMMSNFPPRTPPNDWAPYAVFDQLYDQAGHDVDPAVMMQGQMLLRIAVNSVAIFSQMPDKVAEAEAPFPWGSQHLLDEEVAGAPPCEGEIIARYWRVLWALAHGQPMPGPVMATLPADGAANHPTDSSSIESWVTLVFSRGLEDDPLTADSLHVVGEGGGVIPTQLWHYYGQDAHIVHLRPQQDFAADTVYTVTVDPQILSVHGEALDGYEFRFSTGATGPDPIVPAWPADHDPVPGDGDGDPAGDGDGDPSGDGDGDDPTDSGSTDAGGSSSDSGEDSSGTGQPGAEDGGGCGCVSGGDPPAPAWPALALLGLAWGLKPRSRGPSA